jgi:type I restriction-modification system DNA methylase subunit
MSTESEPLQDRLQKVQEEHRRRYLSDELNEIAAVMEETILQRTLAKAFFEEQIELDTDAKERVHEILRLLEQDDYDAVEDRLPNLRDDVDAAEQTVENRIQELRLKHNSTVTAMRRLNDRVDRVSGMRLQALEGLLDDWRWKEHVYRDEDDDLADLKENASEYGDEMRTAFEDLKEELFGLYPEEIRGLIYRMIDDERLSYADLSDNQRQLLAESDIGDYIELTLS